jgi:hypothetical protein
MTNPSNAQSPHAASDEAREEAVRREAVIRPLAAAPRLSKAAVGVAARALGLSAPRVYGLLRVFRRQPVTASLLPTQPGPTKGTRRLAGAIEAKIDAAIEAVYLKPERPTLRRTLREVRQDCRDAGLRPPSIKALRARVSVRSLRDRAGLDPDLHCWALCTSVTEEIAARKHAAAARERARQEAAWARRAAAQYAADAKRRRRARGR